MTRYYVYIEFEPGTLVQKIVEAANYFAAKLVAMMEFDISINQIKKVV